jgi:hypothetical protein
MEWLQVNVPPRLRVVVKVLRDEPQFLGVHNLLDLRHVHEEQVMKKQPVSVYLHVS